MTEQGTGDETPGIDYAALMREALVDVVRKALGQAAASGLPGEHHFYLTVGSAEEGVQLPTKLRRQFPDEITLVLQHQFWNLAVDEHGFSVTLRFGGAPERVVVPWTALRTFADPSVGFGLRLQPEAAESADPEPAAAPPKDEPREARAKVVAFRRRPDEDLGA